MKRGSFAAAVTRYLALPLVILACARSQPTVEPTPVHTPDAPVAERPIGRIEPDPPDDEQEATEDAWEPRSMLHIARFPKPISKAMLPCPAVTAGRVHGTVVLEVDVRRDGSVREARVLEGIGHGCDEVAVEALRQTVFEPALDTRGVAADVVIGRWEYTFVARHGATDKP